MALPFFGIGMKTDLFQSCGHCCVFQICWHIECTTEPPGLPLICTAMSQSPKAGSQAASSLLCAPSYDFTPQSVFPTKCFISFSKYTYLTPQYIPYPSFIPWDSYCQQGQKKKHLIINSYLELITYHLPGKISCRGKSFTSS